MVLLVHKKNEDDQFMFECTCNTANEDAIAHIVRLSNGRFRLSRLADQLEKMIDLNSPDKSDDDNRVVADDEGYSALHLNDHQKTVLDRAVNDARLFLSKKQVEHKVSLNESMIQEQVSAARTAITIANPAGFPEGHVITKLLTDDQEESRTHKEWYDENSASLWWSNRELSRGQNLGNFIGKNEKTKIMVKLARSGASGPPARDNTETQQQKEMMAYYYKKQKEHERMEQDDDDSFVNSAWADPKQLKTAFNGLNNISWKPK